MNQKAFIVKNENEVNIITTRILLWATLAFPAIIILCILGIFTGKVNELVPLFSIGMVCAISPYILRKLHLNSTFIKYFTIIMSTVCVGILATNPHINVNIMYVFPIGLSCLYFDKRLTRITLILGLINLIVSKYFFCISYHALGKTDVADGFTYYIAILSGLLIEFFATSLIFSMLARRTKTLLESLVDSEEQTNLLNQLKEIMNKSLNASNVLASSANRLLHTIDEASKSNETIAGNASNASSGCEKNLEYVENTSSTIENISAVLKSISIQSKEASQLSNDTFTAAEESEKIIKDSIANMENVEVSTTQSKELINKLGETSKQIGAIVEIITGITKQTNLLALNAAIEASRAGEHGKGFSVVAGEIRKLAEQSANATQEISSLIKNIQENTKNAVESIDKNSETIRLGIDMVRGTGKSFEKLKNLQFKSTTRIQEIASSSDSTSEYSGKLLNIVNDIKSLTTKSLNEMESIAASTEQQTAAMQEIAASFQVIDNIANDLLVLSNSIDTI